MDGDNQITDVAVADGPTGRIAIVYKESEGGLVMFQPRAPALAGKVADASALKRQPT
jgi:hypothetical protein